MMFAPAKAKIKNPDRFAFQYCPIYRSYTSSITEDSVYPKPLPFAYNAWETPSSSEETMALFKEWEKAYKGPTSVFEYHFWRKQYRDPGAMDFAYRVYKDTYAYKIMGMQGCMEDGSNKSFFPNGFAGHIYAETLMNRELDYEKELEDYYKHLYGEDWRLVKEYLEKITDTFDFGYMLMEKAIDKREGAAYLDPSRVERFAKVKEITSEIKKVIEKNSLIPIRPQSIAWQDLSYHTKWCEHIAAIMTEKCQNHREEAIRLLEKMQDEFGKYDSIIGDRFDFILAMTGYDPMVRKEILGEEIVN